MSEDEISGYWELVENEKFLLTDLSTDIGASTGYETIYFFPKNEIIELDRNKMLLESLRENDVFDGNGGKRRVKNITRSKFIKIK